MSSRELAALVARLPVSPGYITSVVEHLTSIGSSPLGFRTAGTPEDAAVAQYVAEQFRAIGLVDVAIEEVAVDAWRFLGAEVRLGADDTPRVWSASSFGGVPGTPAGGVTARLVDVGDPRRSRLDHLDLDGAIVLVDWRSKQLHPSVFAFELARRGVRGMIVNCPSGGAWYQGEHALGAFDGHWPAGGPPMLLLRKEDAAALREHASGGGTEVTAELRVELWPAARGHNVVGYLPGIGDDDGCGPLVVGAHHDAWFRGAFDNTSGVAAMLAIAKALTDSAYRPRHRICFTSRTGEEYGILDSPCDWCVGAWEQIATTHPDWAEHSPFHLCVEASGHPALRTIVEAPVELRSWARRICRLASAQGWTPTGWRVAPPVAGTEQWPYLVSGVPGVAAYAWETSFADSDYHTDLDTMNNVDANIVAAQTRLYTLLLLDADAAPEQIYDFTTRALQLDAIANEHAHPGLAASAARLRTASGRKAFTPIGQGLHALDAHMELTYPQTQAERDLSALDTAIAAIDRGDRNAARRALRKVGSNALTDYLSAPAFAAYLRRFRPERLDTSWGGASSFTDSPDLSAEIDALRRPTALDDPALRSSLLRHRASTRRELERRLDAMARCLAPADSRKETL